MKKINVLSVRAGYNRIYELNNNNGLYEERNVGHIVHLDYLATTTGYTIHDFNLSIEGFKQILDIKISSINELNLYNQTLLECLNELRQDRVGIKICYSEDKKDLLYETNNIAKNSIKNILTPMIKEKLKPKEKKEEVKVEEKNSKQSKFFKELEERLINSYPRLIRFEKLMKKGRKDKNVKEFLIRFFNEFNYEKNTIYVDDNSIQTAIGKNRSIGDIFMLVKYYYPEANLQEVYNIIINELPNEIVGFRGTYCNTIKKYVWYKDEKKGNQIYHQSNSNEYGYSYNHLREELNRK